VRTTTAKASHQRDLIAAVSLAVLVAASGELCAQQSEEEIALAAQNPVAAMVSVPLQYNYDQKIGPQRDGRKNYVNVQPVTPFSLNANLNLISRTILPLVWQTQTAPGTGSQSGIGDTTQSFFFSPKRPTAGGWIWGAGPVVYLPTASDKLLGANKWGLGPTAVFLKQAHGWTYGALVNHIWSVGGAGSVGISNTYLQPFLTYTTKGFTSFSLNSESTYNWQTQKWSVPLNFMVSQMLKVGPQRLQLQAGARYWADGPDSAAHGWGVRVTVTFLFPN
jgi:hypothetical protein